MARKTGEQNEQINNEKPKRIKIATKNQKLMKIVILQAKRKKIK